MTEAVATVGISQDAVRKRRECDTNNGHNGDDQSWIVLTPRGTTRFVDTTAAVAPSDMSTDQAESLPHASRTQLLSATAQAQLDAFRDAILRPHLERIESLASDNGRLLAERDQARGELRAAISDREQANQRLASDRALLDMVIARIDTPGEAGGNELSRAPLPRWSSFVGKVDALNQRAPFLIVGTIIVLLIVVLYRTRDLFDVNSLLAAFAVILATIAFAARSDR